MFAVDIRSRFWSGRAAGRGVYCGRMTLRQRLRNLLTMLLVLCLMPGLTELIETVEHLVHDGHLPHSEQHDQGQHAERHDSLEEEHGCTAMAHQCGCHMSAPAILTDANPRNEPGWADVAETRPVAVAQVMVSWANAPPTRPPIT